MTLAKATPRPDRLVRRTGTWATVIVGCLAYLFAGLAAPDSNAHAVQFKSKIKTLEALPPPRAGYPVPTDENMLFYLQRSKNTNTVIYAARMTGTGVLDSKNPVDVFWRRFKTTGNKRDLKKVERKLAYGIVAEPYSKSAGAYLTHIVSYPKRKAIVKVDGDGRPVATMKLGDRTVRLSHAFADVDTSGFFPDVKSVDIYGFDVKTGKVVWEHIEPVKKDQPSSDR